MLESVAAELVVVIDAAVRSAPDDPLERIDAVVRAVFRPAVRRPALLGLVREVSRLPAAQADRLRQHVQPLVERCVEYMALEMDKGNLRRGDPGLIAALSYATVTGHRDRAGGAACGRVAADADRAPSPPRRAAVVPPDCARATRILTG